MDNIIIGSPKEYEENSDIKKFKEKNELLTVTTDEPVGKYKAFTFSVICGECHKVHKFQGDSESELELVFQQMGWVMAPDENQNYLPCCPECVRKLIKKDLTT